ncbi:ATP-binding cassette domain-containing protein, partial [Bombilactobacillus bombi]|uniref:ATP-binding cassette domain-containing protein n=1 Tax=Bombilactobacillus bombi TaxID=1303590 RepID=UPI0015E60BF2
MKDIIRCNGLTVQFKKNLFSNKKFLALDNITIQVFKNEIFGIIGPSGAGKTTLLNVLTKQIQNYSGKIEIDGNDIKNIKQDFFKKISLFAVDSGLYMDLSVYDNLLLYAKVYGKKEEDVYKLIKE